MLTIYSEQHLNHHPELEFFEGELRPYQDSPVRVQYILDALKQAGLGQVHPPADHGIQPIIDVHAEQYISYLQHAYQDWVAEGGLAAGVYPDTFPHRSGSHRPARTSGLAGYYCTDLTAIITAGTWQAAYAAAQCALTAADVVRYGALRGSAEGPWESACFALCRPPGHHAGYDYCGGYCFLNNAAIAAQALTGMDTAPTNSPNVGVKAARRVAVLDIDFHHGNGTQAVFYSRADVLYVSLHADPNRQYPYFSGSADECGEGEGTGYTVNFPLPKGIDDQSYLAVLDRAEERIAAMQPHYLVVSLGVDTCLDDPLGDFALTDNAYPSIGERLAQLGLPTVFIMEGGYANRQLGRHVVDVLSGFQSNYN